MQQKLLLHVPRKKRNEKEEKKRKMKGKKKVKEEALDEMSLCTGCGVI